MATCNERMRLIREDKLQKRKKLTILAEEWLENVRLTRQPSTFVKYRQVYIKYIEGAIEQKRVSDVVTPGMQRKLLEVITSSALSESTLRSIYTVFKQITKFGDIELVTKVSALNHPAVSCRRRPIKTLSLDEQSRLFTFLNGKKDAFGQAVLFCLNTGLRIGEVCSLKWKDIDIPNKVFSVNRTVQRLPISNGIFKTQLVENIPKSEKSRRCIPLNNCTLALVEDLDHSGEYVFGGISPMDPRTLQYNFKQITRAAGISDINFHVLRHTFATNCIESGMDTKTLSELLGHSDVGITLDRYVHPSMNAKRRSMSELEAFYEQLAGR